MSSLSTAQCSALEFVVCRAGATSAEFARDSGRSRSYAGALLRSLERDGLIAGTLVEGGRLVYRATRAGAEIAATAAGGERRDA